MATGTQNYGYANSPGRKARPFPEPAPSVNNNLVVKKPRAPGRVQEVLMVPAGTAPSASGAGQPLNRARPDEEQGLETGTTKRPSVIKDFLVWQRKIEEEYMETQSTWFRVWNARCTNITSYFVGFICFVIFFHVRSLPALSYPVTGNLADWDPEVVPYVWWKEGAVLVEAMWGYTHLRKTILVIISAARIRAGTTHAPVYRSGDSNDIRCGSHHLRRVFCIGAIVYHVVFGVWMGWANNIFSGYLISDFELVISGMVVYFGGELTVTIGTVYYLYKKKEESRVFRNVRLAAEMFIWAGILMVSMTLPSVLIFMGRFALLTYFIYLPDRASCA